MLRVAIPHLFCLLLLAIPLPASASAEPSEETAPATSPSEAARTHYARGLALYEQRAYAGALAEFQRAYALVPSPKLLFSMGQAHAGMGHYARAIEELGAYLERVGAPVPEERRLHIERQLEAFRERVGRLDVTVNVADASITVDGTAVGKSPLREPLVLDAGPHRVTAERTDHMSTSARVSVVGAETTPVHLALQATPEESVDLSTPLWIATGLCGALALGSGIATLIQRRNYDESLEQGHPGAPDAIQRDLQQQRSRLQSWLIVTDILIGATVVSGAAAIYVSVRESDGPERVTTGGAIDISAGVRGRF